MKLKLSLHQYKKKQKCKNIYAYVSLVNGSQPSVRLHEKKIYFIKTLIETGLEVLQISLDAWSQISINACWESKLLDFYQIKTLIFVYKEKKQFVSTFL